MEHYAMKAYLATTGTIFGLLAVLHIWRIVAEWNGRVAQTWYLASVGLVGIVLPTLLAIWAAALFLRSLPSRNP
jgi:hypothetical protein